MPSNRSGRILADPALECDASAAGMGGTRPIFWVTPSSGDCNPQSAPGISIEIAPVEFLSFINGISGCDDVGVPLQCMRATELR